MAGVCRRYSHILLANSSAAAHRLSVHADPLRVDAGRQRWTHPTHCLEAFVDRRDLFIREKRLHSLDLAGHLANRHLVLAPALANPQHRDGDACSCDPADLLALGLSEFGRANKGTLGDEDDPWASS